MEFSSSEKPYIQAQGHLQKKVLFIITQSDMGGAQRFLLNLVSHLDKEKFQPLVAVGQNGDGWLLNALKELGAETRQINSLIREPGFWENFRAISDIRKIIKDFRPDTVFLNSSKAGFLGSMAVQFPIRIKNIKVIYRIGGWTFNDPWPKWKKALWEILEWVSAKWKDIIIVNNQKDFQQAKKLHIKPRRKLSLIYNGVETYKLGLLSKDEARLRLFEKISGTSGKIFQADKIIGTIANFYPAKGLEYLIRSAYYFQDQENVIFVVIGDGNDRLKLESTIKELGLEKKVFLTGQIADAFKYLPSFDVFVLPSLKEGFPWSLIEAMAAKVPVVATRVGANTEIIEDHKNGILVEPGKPQSLADAVKEILDSDRLQKEFGIQAHQTVLFKFELDKMVKQIEELL